ncbi:hypothetical protein GE061_000871 [Apolygus lucorum]|uniref:RNase H type-1 domain-containing protein n=1 Tax=Apolygus lucorum TaxID=248454 RepID=A0A8S9Y7P9_APOLU|nr:hypothetical protein GE061_000871 [Apolygus lucorum]
MYTDGSKFQNGDTASAHLKVSDHSSSGCKIHPANSIYQAELIAISNCLSKLIDTPTNLSTGLLILTDSKAALEQISNLKVVDNPPHILQKIINSIDHLCNETGTSTILQWVPGHSHIHYNDCIVKTIATKLSEYLEFRFCQKTIRPSISMVVSNVQQEESNNCPIVGIPKGRKVFLDVTNFRSEVNMLNSQQIPRDESNIRPVMIMRNAQQVHQHETHHDTRQSEYAGYIYDLEGNPLLINKNDTELLDTDDNEEMVDGMEENWEAEIKEGGPHWSSETTFRFIALYKDYHKKVGTTLCKT